jgi:hypothetical protein
VTLTSLTGQSRDTTIPQLSGESILITAELRMQKEDYEEGGE